MTDRDSPLTVARAIPALKRVAELGSYTEAAKELGVAVGTLQMYAKRFPHVLRHYDEIRKAESAQLMADAFVTHLRNMPDASTAPPWLSMQIVKMLLPHVTTMMVPVVGEDVDEGEMQQYVAAAAKGDWKAASFLLQNKWPTRWGQIDRAGAKVLEVIEEVAKQYSVEPEDLFREIVEAKARVLTDGTEPS